MTTESRDTEKFSADLKTALEISNPPRPASGWRATLLFAWRSVLKIWHVPEQLLDALLFPVLFVVMFTYVFGGAIAGSTENYLQFALPGILAQTVLFLTIYTGITVNTDISKGVLDRFRTLPVWRPAHLLGMLLADWLRYGIATAMCLAIGALIGYRAPGSVFGVLGAISVLLIFCFALNWVWIVVGLKVRTPSAVQGLASVILFPLTFVSSAYAPTETMPTWLQNVVRFNPMSQLVDVIRGLMNGTADVTGIILVLTMSVVMIAISAPIAMRIYNNIG